MINSRISADRHFYSELSKNSEPFFDKGTRSVETRTNSLGKFENCCADKTQLDNKVILHTDCVDKSSLKETNLIPFFNTLKSTNFEKAVKFIDHFDIRSTFSSDLWDFADNVPSVRIPFRNFEGNCVSNRYYITNAEWIRFKNDLQVSILTLVDLSESAELSGHGTLLDVYARLINKLIEISAQAESADGMNELSPELFSSLKMENKLITQLGMELRNIEKDHLLEFLGNLAALTLNRNANSHKMNRLVAIFSRLFGYPPVQPLVSQGAKSQKITKGLEKLRDYINLRNPRQRVNMSFGKMGVAEFIYGYCLKTLLPEFNDRDQYTRKMTKKKHFDEELIEVASARNIGGYHFVCDVLTDKGVATFDSIGPKKTLDTCLVFDSDNLAVSKSFYNSCRPFAFDDVSVPIQKDNNCYLAAGWLKFCIFLHFFEQSMD